MVGAALLAKKAVERGLTRQPWVKTTARSRIQGRDRLLRPSRPHALPGEAGLQPRGYGCVTCIGNSGPLPDEVSAAVNATDLAVVSVLSGNRNFEGRIQPDVR